MKSKDKIKKEVFSVYEEGAKLAVAFQDGKETNFHYDYQRWYSKAIKAVEVLAPDRYSEFKSYYEKDPKRKSLGYGTYVIQDYLKGVGPSSYNYPDFDTREQALKNLYNQITIFLSIHDRIDSSLENIESELFSEITDSEIETARKLIKINIRAAGALAGVVIENYLQKLASHHKITIRKKSPTISDLNDPLKSEGVYATPTWRKISYLADIRNICSHKKETEPTKEQVEELVEGANWLVKNVF